MAKTAPKPAPPNPATTHPAPVPVASPALKADDPLSLLYGSSQPGEGVLLTPSQKAAQGPQAEAKTVKMDVLQDRSYNGVSYKTGDTVDVPEEYVEALTLSGFGARADRVELAKAVRESSKSAVAKPLTTHDVLGAKPTKE